MVTASARFDDSSESDGGVAVPVPVPVQVPVQVPAQMPVSVPGGVPVPAPGPSTWWRSRAGWTVGRVWLAWLLGHSVLVVPLAWAYLADGYDTVPYDVRIYAEWGASLAAGDGLPVGDDRWQYPPGAAVVFAVPAVVERLVGLPYPVGFVAGMLVISAAVTAVLLRRRSAGAAGLWAVGVWAVGQVAVARFDLVPAGFAVLALVAASDRRWGRAGWAAGAGALVKVWPMILLVAVGRVRRDLTGRPASEAVRGPRDLVSLGAGLARAVAALVVVAVAAGWWRDLLGFVGAQRARGLQLESVAATPLVLARAFGVGGAEAPVYAYGSMQFGSPLAQTVATGCSVVGVVVLVGAVVWWWGFGRVDGSTVADRCFLLMVLVVVTARVLSPQYLLWLLAVAACGPDPWGAAASTGVVRLWRRPAVLLLSVALLSQLVYPMTYDGLLAGDLLPSLLLAARNGVLVALCVLVAKIITGAATGSRDA